MIKKILIVTIILILAAGGFLGFYAYNYPKRMYQSWIRGEEFNEWFFIPNYGPRAFANQTRFVERNIYRKDADSVWKSFHVMDVRLSLPFRHPLYTVVPIAKQVGGKEDRPQLGFDIFYRGTKKLASIVILSKSNFKLLDHKQKIFKIPFFKQHIDSVNIKDKWRDIFLMKFQDMEMSVKQMVYQLYILDQRMGFLPSGTKTFGYITDVDGAVVEYTSKDKDFKTEIMMIQRGGIIHSFLLSTRLEEPEAKMIRARLIRELRIEPDSENVSRSIYEEFKSLPYAQQITSDGMLYLFSAWSHTTNDKEFFRVMIQFLERGKDNYVFLEPLYTYAYERFGTSFSRYDYRLKEKAEEEFKRKLLEEEKRARLELENKKVEDINLNDLSEQERIDYLLKKAKEKKTNSADDKVIIVD